ncbi:General control protein [Maublancomyces gigas]|uniref:General control protein n=1 Tax=Discina gigas TaxID=1032678 RepID=A0ABR3GGX1_9PEZI
MQQQGTVSSHHVFASSQFNIHSSNAFTTEHMKAFDPEAAFNELFSPDMSGLESYDTSPLFAPDDVSPDNNWYSLFPETNPDNDDSSVSPPLPSQNQDHSPAPGSGYSDDDILDQPDSPGTSPIFRSSSSGPQRRSVTSGVRKNRGPLPPIVVEDPSDTVAMKRARNTLAARKSRAKKLERMEEMEVEIEKLKAQVEHWKNLAMNQNRRRS